MIATLGVRGLTVWCVLGVYEEERTEPRAVRFDVEMDYDIERIGQSDDIRDGLDYDRVAEIVREHAVWAKYQTLEALVSGVVDLIVRAYPFLTRVRVSVAKPGALRDADESWVALQVEADT